MRIFMYVGKVTSKQTGAISRLRSCIVGVVCGAVVVVLKVVVVDEVLLSVLKQMR